MGGYEKYSKLASPEYEHLLALSALFEGVFSIDWVVGVTGQKASQVLSALEEGEQEGWLTKKGPGRFCYRDGQSQKQWEGKLTLDEKDQFHHRVADILMKELPDDQEKVLALAHHLLHTQNDADRCRWLMKAGEIHRQAFRAEEALKCYTKVLDDLSRLEGEEVDRLFTEAAVQYSRVSTTRPDSAKVLSILQEALIRAKKWDNQPHQALLEMHLARNEWLRSHYRRALEHFERGWSLAKELDQPELLRSAYTFSIWFLFWQGRFQEAVSSYEKFVPDIHKFPQGRFSLLSAIMVAHCYALTGQVTQGLGMLDAIRTQCQERGDRSLAAQAATTMGAIMLDIQRVGEALRYLESSVKEGIHEHNEWVEIWGGLMLALAYYLKKEKKRASLNLQRFFETSSKVQMTVRPYPYLFELLWAIEQRDLPPIAALLLQEEVQRMISGENVFMKGVAYRYRAFLQKRQGASQEVVIQSLTLSLKWLEESGNQIERAKSQLELGRQFLLLGKEKEAREITLMASKILFPFNEALVPDDVRCLIKDFSLSENLLNEILRIGQEVVTIRDDKDLVQHIISSVNRLTGAERGAIFLLEENSNPSRLRPRATKNLTVEQINHPSFHSSLEIIEEVARTGKGRISEMNHPGKPGSPSKEIIRSRICVPMILKDKVVGVLYHDNRLLSSVFKAPDLELLTYFAAMAAFALDNVRAYEEIQRLNQKLTEEKLYYEEQHLQSIHFEDIVGESAAIKSVLNQVDQVAGTDTNVLILGETGVGKELVARAIHRYSRRREKPFIRVLCSALPDSLIPSELFGHEKGAFTGAIRQQIGRFELADGGTLFLDEIGDLPLDVQVRLLRVLQTKEFERVGGSETHRSDFRLIAATNRHLQEEVKTGKFRADLYYRLNVFPIQVPPLRERQEDILLLAHYFLKIYATKMGKTFEKIPAAEMEKLFRYDWPGNVRELENIIERGTILNSGPIFRVPAELKFPNSQQFDSPSNLTFRENERRHLLWVLQKTGWKIRGHGGAAEILDLRPSTLASRMKKLGIKRPNGIPQTRTHLQL